jgi:hypothetical protein
VNHIPSIQSLSDSARSISLAKVPTAQQIHDVCGKCAQMAADLLDGPVTMVLPVGLRVVREPTPKVAKLSA